MNDMVVQEKIKSDAPIMNFGGGGVLQARTLRDVVDFSQLMCKAGPAIPKFLRDSPGACMAITMQAMRWEMDPFAVANKAYHVNDRVAYEAQLIAAVITTRAPLKTRPTYSFSGDGPAMTCTIVAVFTDGTSQPYTSPRFGDITVKNSPLWKTDPQQQLGYYSIRAWGRRYCPEVILGVYDKEEVEALKQEPIKDITPRNPLLPPKEPEQAPFLDRFADALGLASSPDELQMVLDTYDSELSEQPATTQEIARLAINVVAKRFADATQAGNAG